MSATLPKLFPWRIFYRVAVIQSLLILLAIGSAGLVARSLLKAEFVRLLENRVRDSLVALASDIGASPGADWCERHTENTDWGLALIRPDGTVLCASANIAASFLESKKVPVVGEASFGSRGESLSGSYLDPSGFLIRVVVPLSGLEATFRVFDTSLLVALAVVASILASLSVWLARRLVFPLGRLILKTQRLLSHQPEVVSKEDLTQEVFDEWADLESNIDRLKRDLAAKTQSLSMEQLELDTLMGAISDAVLAVDPEGGPLFFNSRFEVLFGSEALRRKNLKLWEVFREPDILSTFDQALKEGRSGATKAIALDQKLGPRRFFSLSVSPLRRQDSSVYGALGIFHDVTELKAAEQMRIDFVANVSHELRTPLTVIKGYADTLLLDYSGKDTESFNHLNSIARNSDRLMNLMNDLLDLSSLESDSIIQKDPLSTLDVSHRIVAQLQGAFSSKNQTVAIGCEAKTVFADMERLEQVLVNLLSNANKYTPAEGKILVDWVSDGPDTLLKVTDTGPGIPVQHHARLFERFYRVDKARSREQGGTGLGLAIVKHIMQRHEGAVWVESVAGSGSAFYCRFPGPDSRTDPKRD